MRTLSLKKKNWLLKLMLFVTFIYSFNYALPLYGASTFLRQYISVETLSIIYSLTAVLTIVSNLMLSRLVSKLHNYKTSIMIALISFASSLSLGVTQNPYLVILFFVTYTVSTSLMFTIINIFINEFENDKSKEGHVRGIFLMLLSTGILFSALLSGLIIKVVGFQMIWILSSILMVPIVYVLHHFYRNIPDPKYEHVSITGSIRSMSRNKNILLVYLSILLLESFYALMVVYMPLYLREVAGIGITLYSSLIIPIVLIPFIVLPYILGSFADGKNGEKDLLRVGLLIMSLSLLAIPFVAGYSLLLTIFVLFMSRVGASTVETMSYSYFFKNVNDGDLGLVSLFGSIRSIATLTTTLVASLIFIFITNIEVLIYIYAAIILYMAYKLHSLKSLV